MLRYTLQDDVHLGLLMPYNALSLSQTIRSNGDYLARYLPFGGTDYSDEDAQAFITRSLRKFAEGNGGTYGIFHGDEVIGAIGLNYINPYLRRTEIGYWLSEAWGGRGIMTQAVRVVTDYALRTLNINRLEVLMDITNDRSANVPARLGFEYEGIRRQWVKRNGVYHDFKSYVMFADTWQPANPPTQHNREFLRADLGGGVELELLMPHHAEVYSAEVRRSYEHLVNWLSWVKPDFGLEDATKTSNNYLAKLADNNGINCAIFYEGQFAGWISHIYWQWIGDRTELGYWLGEAFQGKGIMTRVVRAMTDYAIRTLGMNRVDILTAVENERSGNVALRLGYEFEGVRRQHFVANNQPIDTNVYMMLAENWR